jgi:hypothetical protein
MTTTDSNRYELNCLIEGEENTFTVSIICTAKVEELRQVIHQKGELGVLQYRVLDLTLWKVCKESLYGHQCIPLLV